MPNTESNQGLSLEALLAAARGEQAAPAPADSGVDAAGAGERAEAVEPQAVEGLEATESAEPAAEPAAVVQEEALETAQPAAGGFDLAAALGYGSGAASSAAASTDREPEEKFDLAAALGYKTPEAEEREAANAAQEEAMARAREVQERAFRNAEREARMREREAQHKARVAERQAAREARAAQAKAEAEARGVKPEEPSVRAAHEPAPRESKPDAAQHELKTEAGKRMEERRAQRERTVRPTSGLGAQSAADAKSASVESYQPTQRDRSAQARAARPLNQEEAALAAEAIAAEGARIEYAEPERPQPEPAAEPVETVKAQTEPVLEEVPVQPVEAAIPVLDQPAAPTGAPVAMPGPLPEPVPEQQEQPQPQPTAPAPQVEQPKPVDFMAPEFASSIAAGAPEPLPAPAPRPSVPPTTPHKVAVRTTEEIIKPANAPVQLGVISPEAARHEAEAKKKVQSKERKIVKKVRRFRALGMFLIVVALAALAGAIFLFVAGNAQASESIETVATDICEEAGRTITYRYKAADSNGTLCPTTEVATFSAGDVLEQSVITMNTPDFETAAHTLANFKKQFQESAYVDGRVDGSIVIFTLHMSNERIMKVTYTALLMANTTGCEVIL